MASQQMSAGGRQEGLFPFPMHVAFPLATLLPPFPSDPSTPQATHHHCHPAPHPPDKMVAGTDWHFHGDSPAPMGLVAANYHS